MVLRGGRCINEINWSYMGHGGKSSNTTKWIGTSITPGHGLALMEMVCMCMVQQRPKAIDTCRK
jgi:hypothetical protein